MAKPITNKVKMGQTPVIKKDLEGGVLGEANNDGTIFVDKSVKEGSPMYKEVVGHEMKHLDQMKSGELSYDDNSVTYKGKKFLRKNGKIIDPKTGNGHPEGSMKFPWEKEADKAGKQARNKKSNDMNYNNKANPITYKSTSAFKKTIAVRDFMKTYGGEITPEDPDKPETIITKQRGIKGGKVGTQTTVETTTPSQRGVDGKIRRIGGPKGSYRLKDLVGVSRDNVPYTERTGEQLAEAGIISKGNVGAWNKKFYEPTKSAPGAKSITKSFQKETKIQPGDPGEEGEYSMGYFEAANQKAKSRVAKRTQRQDLRQAERLYYKDLKDATGKRTKRKDRVGVDPRTGLPFSEGAEGMRERAEYRAQSRARYDRPTSTRSGGTEGDLDKTVDITADMPEAKGLKNLDKDNGSKANNKKPKTDVSKSLAGYASTDKVVGLGEMQLKKPAKIERDLPMSGRRSSFPMKSSSFKMSGYGKKK